MKLFLLKSNYNKLFTVNKSYHENFKSLDETELSNLCKHNSLLEKVHKEMKTINNDFDIGVFNKNLQVIQNSGKGFNDLYNTAFIDNSVKAKSDVINLFLKKTVTSGKDFSPIWTKLTKKSAAEGNDVWVQANKCVYKHTDILNQSAVKHLTNGLTLEKVTLYNRFSEAVQAVSTYVNGVWTSADFTHIINLCKTNEKFVFIFLFPYFLKPLCNIIWPTLLSHFHFVAGSFTIFMQKISDLLNKGTQFNHMYRTLSVKKSIKVALGFSGIGLLALYQNILSTKTQARISNVRLYDGLSGITGFGVSLVRKSGSKIVYEVAKTLSTFSNAAIAGALEPKQEGTTTSIFRIVKS